MMEAVLMLAVIARRYHIELLPHTELRFSPSVTLRPAGAGLRARIVPRAEEASRRAEVVARA
jgi:hypothetical protein